MYKFYFVPIFERQLRDYRKRFPSISASVEKGLALFVPESAAFLGRKLYKLRLKILEIPRGKSGSFRLIVIFLSSINAVIPLALYFKGDRAIISIKELAVMAEQAFKEVKQRYSIK